MTTLTESRDSSERANRDPGPSSIAVSDGTQGIWQWEHKTGFRDYDAKANRQLETAYQLGERQIRIRSGKKGAVPMMVFFHDMLQFDPITCNSRRIRRRGRDSIFGNANRWMKSLMLEYQTGKSRKMCLEIYMLRRNEVAGNAKRAQATRYANEEAVQARSHMHQVAQQATCTLEKVQAKYQVFCEDLLANPFFFLGTSVVVTMNVIWIVVLTSLDTLGPLAKQENWVLVIEWLFCIAFISELLVRYLAMVDRTLSGVVTDIWFCGDAIIVSCMLAECIGGTFGKLELEGFNLEGGNLDLFRVLRVLRMFKLLSFSRIFPGLFTLLMGIAAAMRSMLSALVLITMLTFIFGVFFASMHSFDGNLAKLADELDNGQPLTLPRFSSVGDSMLTLLLYGLFLDEITTVIALFRKHEVTFLCPLVFLVYTFLGAFTLLNMLIGFQCGVASKVTEDEQERADVTYLKTHLLRLLEAYDKDDDEAISEEEFALLLEDPELHEILNGFGTDMQNFVSLTNVVLEECKEVSFVDILQMVLRLRGRHAARATDVVALRQYLCGRLDRLEQWIHPDSTPLRAFGMGNVGDRSSREKRQKGSVTSPRRPSLTSVNSMLGPG